MSLPRHSPTTADEVRDLVARAVASGTRLEILGSGAQRELHSPVTADAALELRSLRGVIDYDPEELVLRAHAGTPLEEIDALLAEREQMLAFEPFDHALWTDSPPGAATLGGAIAANVGGPRRLSSGAARDHVLGFTAISGRGEALKGGGAVVKNVTGFDLPKLMAGSWGTLAVLLTLTVRVVPRPRVQRTLIFRGLTDAAAHRLMTAALGTAAGVSAAAHLPATEFGSAHDRGAPTTALRLEGFGPSVEARARALERHLASFGHAESLHATESAACWRAITALESLPRSGSVWWRVCVPPARGHEVRAAVGETTASLLYDWGGGLVWIAFPESAPTTVDERIRESARALGGHARLVRASAERRARAQATAAAPYPSSSALGALNARIKAAFDPAGILNPGLDPAGEL